MRQLLLLLLLGCAGCKVIDVSYNKLRVGWLDDHQEELPDGSTYRQESTLGLALKWFPDPEELVDPNGCSPQSTTNNKDEN